MTIKGDQKTFKLKNYQISINPITDKKLNIQVIDTQNKIEFAEKQLTLDKIGFSTLVLALQAKRKEISITPAYKKQGQFEILELKVSVQSAFLRNIEQTIYIKKIRNVAQIEVLDSKMKSIASKIKTIKQKNPEQGITYYAYQQNQQSFNGASYQNLATIKLKKGTYLLTFSYLVKATSQWIYIYLNQGQSIMSNAGYYVPSPNQFIPFSIRCMHTVSEQQKDVSFTTCSASSYPVVLRNRIITAQQIKNSNSP